MNEYDKCVKVYVFFERAAKRAKSSNLGIAKKLSFVSVIAT